MKLRGLELVLTIEKLDLARSLVRLVFFLQFEHRAFVRGLRNFFVQLALAVEERERCLVIACFLQILAVLAQQACDFGRRTGPLVPVDRFVGEAFALLEST